MITYPLQMERVFYRGPSEHLVMKATILQSYNQKECERALKELLYVHPRLSCTVHEDHNHNIYYQTNDHATIPLNYFAHSNECNWESVVKAELQKPFIVDSGLSIRACVVVDSNEFDFILICHHLLGDGLSLLYAYQDFLEIYLHKRKLLQHSCPPLELRHLPKNSKLNLITRGVLHHLNTLWKKEKPQYQSSDFPELFQNYQNKNSSDFIVGSLDSATLMELYEKAHEYNVTMNSILITAFLYNIIECPISTQLEQKVIVATDLRHKTLLHPIQCFGNYASCISPTLTYAPKEGFWSNAQRIHKIIYSNLSSNKSFFMLSQIFGTIDSSIFDGLYFDGYTEFHSEQTKKIGKILKMSHNEEGFDISNLGKYSVDVNSKLTLVKDFNYLPPMATASDFTLGVITVSNQMNITLLYNEHSMDSNMVEALLKHTLILLSNISKSNSEGERNEKESEKENVI